jgi:hypothetical protein
VLDEVNNIINTNGEALHNVTAKLLWDCLTQDLERMVNASWAIPLYGREMCRWDLYWWGFKVVLLPPETNGSKAKMTPKYCRIQGRGKMQLKNWRACFNLLCVITRIPYPPIREPAHAWKGHKRRYLKALKWRTWLIWLEAEAFAWDFGKFPSRIRLLNFNSDEG